MYSKPFRKVMAVLLRPVISKIVESTFETFSEYAEEKSDLIYKKMELTFKLSSLNNVLDSFEGDVLYDNLYEKLSVEILEIKNEINKIDLELFKK